MSHSPACSRCGASLGPADEVHGLCPGCRVDFAFADTRHGTPPAPTTVRVSGWENESRLAGEFGPYRVEGVLGRGGMGVVYRALQPALGRHVAIKVLPEQLARDPAFTERFQREARAMAGLSHSSIVSLYDFGCQDGRYYFAMELVEGPSLRELLRGGPLPQARAREIVGSLCDALEYAHARGLVHRDLKPENVLLDASGRVKLTDFGLAKISLIEPSGAGALTRTGTVLGTAHYMAPEQLERPREVGPSADLYALGVLYYEMLTGELPIGRFGPPSGQAAVGPEVDDLIHRLLDKRPQRRPASAAAVRAELDGIASGRTRRRRILRWTAPAAAACVAFACAGVYWSARPPGVVPRPVLGPVVVASGRETKPAPTANATPDPALAETPVIQVATAAELLAAIGSDRTIELAPGEYRLSDLQEKAGPSIRWVPNSDGSSLSIQGVQRLRIVGRAGVAPRLIVEPRYVFVLHFQDCRDVTLENLVLGHAPELGYCDSGVLGADRCERLTLRACDLFGCGTYGLQMAGVKELRFEDSIVRDCSFGILILRDCPSASFVRSRFEDNQEYSGFCVYGSSGVTFTDCSVERNRINEDLFAIDPDSRVQFVGGAIRNNRAQSLATRPGNVELVGVTVLENSWQR